MTGAATVSVVIAAHGGDGPLAAAIEAHLRELEAGDEIVVVQAGNERGPWLADPRVRCIVAGPGELTPRLWGRGLGAARGEWVRLGIAPMVPEPGWRTCLAAAHRAGVAGLGGAIEPGPGLKLRDWAIFFLRYRSYLAPFVRREVADVPGDHASYRRDALAAAARAWGEEFWEREVNAVLAALGQRLILDPAFRCRYLGGEPASRFLAQRFRHGVEFGRVRLETASPSRRWLQVLAGPLPGAVFLGRIVGDVLGRGRHLRPFLLCLPWLLAFLAAWSLGEWLGALRSLSR
jgi:hypothetical protein